MRWHRSLQGLAKADATGGGAEIPTARRDQRNLPEWNLCALRQDFDEAGIRLVQGEAADLAPRSAAADFEAVNHPAELRDGGVRELFAIEFHLNSLTFAGACREGR